MARYDVKGHWLECQGQWEGGGGETGTEIVGWALEALFSLALVVNGLSYTSRTSQVQVAVIQSMSGQEEGI